MVVVAGEEERRWDSERRRWRARSLARRLFSAGSSLLVVALVRAGILVAMIVEDESRGGAGFCERRGVSVDLFSSKS